MTDVVFFEGFIKEIEGPLNKFLKDLGAEGVRDEDIKVDTCVIEDYTIVTVTCSQRSSGQSEEACHHEWIVCQWEELSNGMEATRLGCVKCSEYKMLA